MKTTLQPGSLPISTQLPVSEPAVGAPTPAAPKETTPSGLQKSIKDTYDQSRTATGAAAETAASINAADVGNLKGLLAEVALAQLGAGANAALAGAWQVALPGAIFQPETPLSSRETLALDALAHELEGGHDEIDPNLRQAIMDLAELSRAELEGLVAQSSHEASDLAKGVRAQLQQLGIKASVFDNLLQGKQPLSTAQQKDALKAAIAAAFGPLPPGVVQQLMKLSPRTLMLLERTARTLRAAEAARGNDTAPTTPPASPTAPASTSAQVPNTAVDAVIPAGTPVSSVFESLDEPITIPRFDETRLAPIESNLSQLVNNMLAGGADIESLVQIIFMEIAKDRQNDLKEVLSTMQANNKRSKQVSQFLLEAKKREAQVRSQMVEEYNTRIARGEFKKEDMSLDDYIEQRKVAVQGDFGPSDEFGSPPNPAPAIGLSPNAPVVTPSLQDSRGRSYTADDALMAKNAGISVEDVLDLREAYNATAQIRTRFASPEEWMVASKEAGGVGLVSPSASSQRAQVADALLAAKALAPPPPASGSNAPAVEETTGTPSSLASTDITSLKDAQDKYGLSSSDALRLFDVYQALDIEGSFANYLAGAHLRTEAEFQSERAHAEAEYDSKLATMVQVIRLAGVGPEQATENAQKALGSKEAFLERKGLPATLSAANGSAVKEFLRVQAGLTADLRDPRKLSADAEAIVADMHDEHYGPSDGLDKDRDRLSKNQRKSDQAIIAWADAHDIAPATRGEIDDLLADLMVAILAESALGGRLQDDKKHLVQQPRSAVELMRELADKCKQGASVEQQRACAEYVTLRMTEFSRDLRQAKSNPQGMGNDREFASKFLTDHAGQVDDASGFGIKLKDGVKNMDYHVHLSWKLEDSTFDEWDGNLHQGDYVRALNRSNELFYNEDTRVPAASGSRQDGQQIEVSQFMASAFGNDSTSEPNSDQQKVRDFINKDYKTDPRRNDISSNALAGKIRDGLAGVREAIDNVGMRDVGSIAARGGLRAVGGARGSTGNTGAPAAGSGAQPAGSPTAPALTDAQRRSLASLQTQAAPPPHRELPAGAREMTLQQLELEAEEWQNQKEKLASLSEETQTKIQILMDAMQQAQTMLSNLMKKIADTHSGIIANMKS